MEKNKYMKRLTALFTAMLILLTLTACDNKKSENVIADFTDKTAYEIYNDAVKKYEGADSVQVKSKSIISATQRDETSEWSNIGTIKEIRKEKDDVIMEINMLTQNSGQNENIKAYYTDGVYYMKSGDSKAKMDTTPSEMKVDSGTVPVEFIEDSIIHQDIEQTNDGVNLSFKLDGLMTADLIERVLGPEFQTMPGAESEVQDVEMTATVDNSGELKEMAVSFEFSATVNDEELSGNCQLSMEVIGISNIDIKLPDDLNSYEEINGLTE